MRKVKPIPSRFILRAKTLLSLAVVLAVGGDHFHPLTPVVEPEEAALAADISTQETPPPAQAAVEDGSSPVIAKEEPFHGGIAFPPEQAKNDLPFVELGALSSDEGERQEDFLVRVAQTMDLFTRTTQYETCGVLLIDEEGTRYRVRLTTNLSHITCVMVQFDEAGFKRLGPDIHSHPYVPEGVVANYPDTLKRREFSCGQRIHILDENFSSVDFRHGAGYLVSRGRLLFQSGLTHPVQHIAEFAPVEAHVALEMGGLHPEQGDVLAAAAWGVGDETPEGLPDIACPMPSDPLAEQQDKEGQIEQSPALLKTSVR